MNAQLESIPNVHDPRGQHEVITTTVQASNLYAIHESGAHADSLPLPAPRVRPFPARDIIEDAG